eukprot:TRINITY_DN472_c0_g1_i2.p1 TRINITY_DN472_c0_g1~~TRINITY_DN472_c0_g1_i2.p1  ORF type:complete len:393 (-),score=68.00 TRINITY_DN472_c0_g1_i2:51-1229(-)
MTAARSPPVSPYAQRIERPDPYRVKVYDEGLAFQIRQPVPTAMTAPHSPISSRQLNSSRSTSGLGGTGTYATMQTARTHPSGSVSNAVQPQLGSPKTQERTRKKIEDAKRLRLAEKYALEQARLQAETERLVQERKAARAAAKEAQYAALYGDVMAGHDLVDELDRAMDIVDSAEYNKRLKQHSEWTQNVYGAIQAQIRQQIDAMDPKALSKQKQDDYQLFLDEANRKPAIFRDIVVESEYDPFAVNRRAIKARVPNLVDPTSRPTDRYAEENAMLGGSGHKLQQRDGRLTLETELWATGKIEDTPHGFMAKMLARHSKVKGKHGRPQSVPLRGSKGSQGICMDHYNVEFGKEVVAAELPRGKRTFASDVLVAPDKPRGRRAVAGLKSLLQL